MYISISISISIYIGLTPSINKKIHNFPETSFSGGCGCRGGCGWRADGGLGRGEGYAEGAGGVACC